jgi:diaminohydroxyphosphoribosylaminopyrimidine deaminase / 5-amino-6-(5-phosphoribosylamino)uracil reductase
MAHARLGEDLLVEYLYPSTQKLLEKLDAGPAAGAPVKTSEAA